MLNAVFVVVEVAFWAWVVRGAGHDVGANGSLLLGLAMLGVVMLAVAAEGKSSPAVNTDGFSAWVARAQARR